MLTQTIANLSVTGSAQAQRGSGGRKGGDDGGFSLIFASAQSSVTGIAPNTGSSSPAPAETTAAASAAEEELEESAVPASEDESETPEIAAEYAVIPPAIPAVRYDTPAAAQPAADTADTTAAAVGRTVTEPSAQPENATPVITVLEGDTDIGASTQEGADVSALSAAQAENAFTADIPEEELTARMPRTTGQQNAASEPETAQSAAPAEGGDLCPLENTNDAGDTGSTGGERPGLEKKTAEPSAGTEIQAESAFPVQQAVDISPERVSSDGQLGEMTADSAVTADNLFDAMVESVETSTANGQDQMVIQLKPDHLGKVAIQLALSDTGLEIRIKSDDLGVKGLISSQITELIQSLGEKGIKVSGVDVVYTEVSDQLPDPNQSQSGGGREEQYTPYVLAGDTGEQIPIYTAFTGYSEGGASEAMLSLGISSVEYTA